jgi:hypothetical protein
VLFLFGEKDADSVALAANQANGVRQICAAAPVSCGPVAPGGVVALERAFTGSKKQIGFHGVLLGVQVVVAPVERLKRLVIPAFDDFAGFHYENLIGAPNRRKPMCDDECRPPAHQVPQPLLNQCFRFGV